MVLPRLYISPIQIVFGKMNVKKALERATGWEVCSLELEVATQVSWSWGLKAL